jgi:hypothetical protein
VGRNIIQFDGVSSVLISQYEWTHILLLQAFTELGALGIAIDSVDFISAYAYIPGGVRIP